MEYAWIGYVGGLLGIIAYIVKMASDYSRLKSQVESNERRIEDVYSELSKALQTAIGTQDKLEDRIGQLNTSINTLSVEMRTRLTYIEKNIASISAGGRIPPYKSGVYKGHDEEP